MHLLGVHASSHVDRSLRNAEDWRDLSGLARTLMGPGRIVQIAESDGLAAGRLYTAVRGVGRLSRELAARHNPGCRSSNGREAVEQYRAHQPASHSWTCRCRRRTAWTRPSRSVRNSPTGMQIRSRYRSGVAGAPGSAVKHPDRLIDSGARPQSVFGGAQERS
jgi:hypothetical protein